MKEYVVYFYIKQNRAEYLADIVVEAKNAKDACKAAKEWYFNKTGKNAFRPTTKPDAEIIARYKERGTIVHLWP